MFKLCFSSRVQRDEEAGQGGLKNMIFFRRRRVWKGGADLNGGCGFSYLWAVKE